MTDSQNDERALHLLVVNTDAYPPPTEGQGDFFEGGRVDRWLKELLIPNLANKILASLIQRDNPQNKLQFASMLDLLDELGVEEYQQGSFRRLLRHLAMPQIDWKHLDAILISIRGTHLAPLAYALVDSIRDQTPDIPIIVGGHHVTGVSAENTQQDHSLQQSDLFVDAAGRKRATSIFIGRADTPFCSGDSRDDPQTTWLEQVLHDLRNGDLKTIYNAMLSPTGSFARDTMPDRSPLTLAEQILHWLRLLVPLIEMNDGCEHHCKFCFKSASLGMLEHLLERATQEGDTTLAKQITSAMNVRNQARSVHNFMRELKDIPEIRILLAADNIALNVPHLISLLDALSFRRKLCGDQRAYMGSIDALALARVPGLVEKLGDTGFQYLFVGYEGGEDVVTEHYQKTQNRMINHPAMVAKAHTAGVHLEAGLIVGLDSQKELDYRKTIRDVIYAGYDTISNMYMAPLPGTKDTLDLIWSGRLPGREKPYKEWGKVGHIPIVTPLENGLSNEELLTIREKMMSTFYSPESIYFRLFQLRGIDSIPAAAARIFQRASNAANGSGIKFAASMGRILIDHMQYENPVNDGYNWVLGLDLLSMAKYHGTKGMTRLLSLIHGHVRTTADQIVDLYWPA